MSSGNPLPDQGLRKLIARTLVSAKRKLEEEAGTGESPSDDLSWLGPELCSENSKRLGRWAKVIKDIQLIIASGGVARITLMKRSWSKSELGNTVHSGWLSVNPFVEPEPDTGTLSGDLGLGIQGNQGESVYGPSSNDQAQSQSEKLRADCVEWLDRDTIQVHWRKFTNRKLIPQITANSRDEKDLLVRFRSGESAAGTDLKFPFKADQLEISLTASKLGAKSSSTSSNTSDQVAEHQDWVPEDLEASFLSSVQSYNFTDVPEEEEAHERTV